MIPFWYQSRLDGRHRHGECVLSTQIQEALPLEAIVVQVTRRVTGDFRYGVRGQSQVPHSAKGPGYWLRRQGQGISTFQTLRFRDFRLLWIGTLFASAEQWIR